ncbi:MAG: DUF3990 domain-containing protein [Lachnospiraceae bacterium]|nr:DUF3990 domain-containing protein [Lachnospiraceae bacterium]
MSAQSDVEILSIEAIEVYAKRHELSGSDVVDLFHKYQVFEKILIQHEYLHQVDFEEVMEYIERIVEENSRELVVYHGSCHDFDKIDLSKSHNRRDFGKGFYTTILKSQSKEWAYRLSLREKKKPYFVYEYLFTENTSLKVKRFDSLSKDWLKFIKENRIKGGLQHDYDIVIGPVADDRTMETIQLYIADILTDEEAVARLKYSKANNQISFHTKKSLKYLRFIRRNIYE